jgi:hypothetical protein
LFSVTDTPLFFSNNGLVQWHESNSGQRNMVRVALRRFEKRLIGKFVHTLPPFNDWGYGSNRYQKNI